HISLQVQVHDFPNHLIVTGFYGHPITARRKESWARLRHLKVDQNTPWLCMGDFNEITSHGEKWGSLPRPFKQMEDFRQSLAECNLGDLGYVGSQFTWCNNREGINFTKERLDRGLVNCVWHDLFDSNSVTILPTICSNHNPLYISSKASEFTPCTHKKIFRHEASWAKQEECVAVIKRAWQGPLKTSSRVDITRRVLERCRFQLREWNNISTKVRHQKVTHKSELLITLQASNTGLDNTLIHSLQKELDSSLEQADLKWHQRAKQRWLQDGDRNTKYFHKCASVRKQKNIIQKLQLRRARF
ncbi:hypothetical protein I3843_14G073700, partial [Carya illinoinensis]